MEMDKRVESMEDEFKLMRGELKQTLTSVRDYLLNLKLSASQEATILQAIGGGGGGDQQIKMDGSFSLDRGGGAGQSELEELPAGEAEEHERPADEAADDELLADEAAEHELPAGEVDDDELPADEAAGYELPDEAAGHGSPEPGAELSEEEGAQMGNQETMEAAREMNQSVPPVNLLANIIRWISNAKKEIGSEQLPVFLEVYGVSGHLSPEFKEVILHLADITAVEPVDPSTAETWSKLILELHGILTGGDAPLHPLKPFWKDGDGEAPPSEIEEDKPEPKPLKLKLVLSDSDGKDKEFRLDLKSDEE